MRTEQREAVPGAALWGTGGPTADAAQGSTADTILMMPDRAHSAARSVPRGRTLWGIVSGRREAGEQGADAPQESWHRRFVRLAPPATLLGLSISLLVHLLILLIAALIAIGGAQAGGAGAKEGPSVELAVVTDSELSAMQQAALEFETPPVSETPTPDAPAVESLDAQAGDLASELTVPSSVSISAGGGDITGLSSLGAGGIGGGAASFFGAEARGTRFAYIVDVSGSMGYDNKLEILKRELARSIDALTENSQFQVVAFSSNAAALGGRREWSDAGDAGKAWARKAIAGLSAGGGTIPSPAFAIVFSLRPRPDAIYFMTDGEFDAAVALDLLRLNAESKVPIHCIAFVSKEAEALMRRIAADSGGTYTYVPGRGP
jgi:hypothetical protein